MKNKPQSANALSRLESAFAHRIAGGHWNANQADFWADLVFDWPESVTVAVCSQAISQYENVPSAAEMLRIKREYLAAQDRPDGPPATLDSMSSNSAMPWYFRWHLAYMRTHKCRWGEARTAMIAEANQRGQKLPRQIIEGKFSWEMED